MTDDQFAVYEAKYAAARALAAEALPGNKDTLFAALAHVGIDHVLVNFDGCGDSGQIEAITAYNVEGKEVSLPAETLTIREVQFETSTLSDCDVHICNLVETMAYGFLEETHDGWENEDGAYGEFTFTVADQSIRLEYNERYIETHYHEHEF